LQIFGTDLDSDAINLARSGVYRLNIAQDISPERLQKFFSKQDDSYQVNKKTREMVTFAVHNIIRDPPFLKLDLISTRNLLIYFKGDLQKKLLPMFHYALNTGGILFLSPSETIGELDLLR
jgi:two-component system CheB/CheR fusion protein